MMDNIATQIDGAFPPDPTSGARPVLYIETTTKDHFIGKAVRSGPGHLLLERDDGRLLMLLTAHIVFIELMVEPV